MPGTLEPVFCFKRSCCDHDVPEVAALAAVQDFLLRVDCEPVGSAAVWAWADEFLSDAFKVQFLCVVDPELDIEIGRHCDWIMLRALRLFF